MTTVQAAGVGQIWGRHATRPSRLWQPRRTAFWVLIAFFAYATVMLAIMLVGSARNPDAPLIFGALVVWIAWAFLLAWILSRADLFSAFPRSARVAAFAWGATVVFTTAGEVNALVERYVLPADSQGLGAILVAPLSEEGFKLLGVVVLAGILPTVLRRPMGGLMAGMLIGLGFAFIENWGLGNGLLASGDYNGADDATKLGGIATWLVSRGILDGPWGHSTYTAISALGVVYFLARRGERGLGRRIAVAVGAYLLAVLAHCGNNTLVTVFDGQSALAYGYALLILIVLLLLIRYVRGEERRWWASTMGRRLGTGVVTDDELTALATRRGRLRARRAAAESGGRSAASAAEALQATQLAYANAVSDAGGAAEATEPAELGQVVRRRRAALTTMTGR